MDSNENGQLNRLEGIYFFLLDETIVGSIKKHSTLKSTSKPREVSGIRPLSLKTGRKAPLVQ